MSKFATKEQILSAQKFLRIGDIVENFSANTTKGDIDFYNWFADSKADYALIFSHPKAKTPVCTTELGKVARLEGEWKKRNVAVLGLSVDDLVSNSNWISQDVAPLAGLTDIFFPIINDDYTLATRLGMINPDHIDFNGLPLTARTVFLIDKNKKIRATITYPASCGRNFDEILRLIDATIASDKHQVATGEGWIDGEKYIVFPGEKTEDAKARFANVEEVRAFLRYCNN